MTRVLRRPYYAIGVSECTKHRDSLVTYVLHDVEAPEGAEEADDTEDNLRDIRASDADRLEDCFAVVEDERTMRKMARAAMLIKLTSSSRP